MTLPVVTHDTFVCLSCDLLRAEIQDPDNANPLGDIITKMATENPEVVGAVGWLVENLPLDKEAALAVMAFTYRLLEAQAETDELEALVVRES